MNEKGFVSEKRFVSKKNLSRAWRRLFGKVLNSKEEIEANTSENMIAGAEAVKEVYSSLGGLSFGTDGDGNYGYYGADGSLIPFKKEKEPITVNIYGSMNGSAASFIFTAPIDRNNVSWWTAALYQGTQNGSPSQSAMNFSYSGKTIISSGMAFNTGYSVIIKFSYIPK